MGEFRRIITCNTDTEGIFAVGDLKGHVSKSAETYESIHGDSYGRRNIEGENIQRTSIV